MCDMPHLAYKTGFTNPKTGKEKIKFLNRIDMSFEDAKSKYGKDLVLIPCGHCASCMKSYSYQWAIRLMAESLYHEESCFLTLTYDNKHLPKKNVFDDDGVFKGVVHPLVKKDLQDFMKRLRFYFPDRKLSFFACGEYGEVGSRPHYHMILFGLKFNDLDTISYNALGQPLYTSKTLSSIWKNGLVSIGEVTAESCGYVSRYSLKKQISGIKSDEFVLMSRRPAIGKQFYLDHKDELYETDRLYCKSFKSSAIPRYFDKLAEVDDDVFPGYELAKTKRAQRSEARQYQDVIAYGLHHIEEAQVLNYWKHIDATHILRRCL